MLTDRSACYCPPSWTYYYVHRPPGSKVVEYEKEIKKVASFGSVSSALIHEDHIDTRGIA